MPSVNDAMRSHAGSQIIGSKLLFRPSGVNVRTATVLASFLKHDLTEIAGGDGLSLNTSALHVNKKSFYTFALFSAA
jgi:hypothetical protein